jgi:hypothetical protein
VVVLGVVSSRNRPLRRAFGVTPCSSSFDQPRDVAGPESDQAPDPHRVKNPATSKAINRRRTSAQQGRRLVPLEKLVTDEGGERHGRHEMGCKRRHGVMLRRSRAVVVGTPDAAGRGLPAGDDRQAQGPAISSLAGCGGVP